MLDQPTDNDQTTWRDLADQLTPKQIAAVERLESWITGRMTPVEMRTYVLEIARGKVAQTLANAVFADISLPPGADTDSEEWTQNGDGSGWSRSLQWARWDCGGVSVFIDGRQHDNGTVTRRIALYEDSFELTADGARALAATLIEAAAALEALQ